MKNFFNKFRRVNKSEIDFKDGSEILEFILNDGLAKLLEYESVRQNDMIYIPELQMHIKPSVQSMQKNSVVLEFDMYSNRWDVHLFECSAGMSENIRSAVGQSLASYAFIFMSGMKRMTDKYKPRFVTSEFAGKTHKWDVYLSDVMCIGSKNEEKNPEKVAVYWNLLKDDIIKRLGNRKLVYVKIFAAKVSDSMITGECRIDDVPIPELGKKVAKIAEQWNISTPKSYVTEKQFFFIEQYPETVLYDPYSSKEGMEKLKALVIEYLKLFNAVDSQESYDRLVYDAKELLGDSVLAAECFSFLPEICAEYTFGGKITINDYIEIGMPDGTIIPLYKSQLSDYSSLRDTLLHIIAKNELGDETQKICKNLISCSSIFNVVMKVSEQKGELNGLSLSKLIFNVDDGFELR